MIKIKKTRMRCHSSLQSVFWVITTLDYGWGGGRTIHGQDLTIMCLLYWVLANEKSDDPDCWNYNYSYLWQVCLASSDMRTFYLSHYLRYIYRYTVCCLILLSTIYRYTMCCLILSSTIYRYTICCSILSSTICF